MNLITTYTEDEMATFPDDNAPQPWELTQGPISSKTENSPPEVEAKAAAKPEATAKSAATAEVVKPAPSNDEAPPVIKPEVSRSLSVIGQTLEFRGELEADEDLLIQGRIQGSIKHQGKNLTIGAHGDVKASIEACRIIIQGKVQGDVKASESVVVESSAIVIGNIYAPCVGIKEGARFKGSIDMDVGADATIVQSTLPEPNRSSAESY